jgi:hypothetical protein
MYGAAFDHDVLQTVVDNLLRRTAESSVEEFSSVRSRLHKTPWLSCHWTQRRAMDWMRNELFDGLGLWVLLVNK